jgi:hypothetical protein
LCRAKHVSSFLRPSFDVVSFELLIILYLADFETASSSENNRAVSNYLTPFFSVLDSFYRLIELTFVLRLLDESHDE